MTVWDPSRVNANISITGGGLTVTLTGTGSQDVAVYANSSHSSGKWVTSATINSAGGVHSVLFGLGTASASVANAQFLGADTQSFGYGNVAGDILLNGGSIATVQASVVGDKVWLATDIDGKLIWVRINNGNWNNSGTANPDTGTGGISISSLASFTLFPGASFWAANDGLTADFSNNAGLSTFSSWDVASVLYGQIVM
jgi:hypothetical protein